VELDKRLRRGADLEADLQRLAPEGRVDREYHISKFGRRSHEQVGVRKKLEGLERLTPISTIGMVQ
jgi:hypothetical protein